MKIALALLLFVSLQVQAQVRSVFKGTSATAMAINTPLKKMNFGLTPLQAERIAALTLGQIQFGDVYFLDHPLNRDFSVYAGFSGRIELDVPPPIEPFSGPGADDSGDLQNSHAKAGDPDLVNQWWIEKLGVNQAWSLATGQGVTIADCDAGYYHDEPDLHANMLLEHRYDLSNPDDTQTVNDGPFATHGTSVAAIMTGVLNGTGTNGIAYNARIVPLQNYNYDGTKDKMDKEEATAACVLRAIATPGVQIIVLENQTANGSSETFIGTRDAVRLALRAGVIIVSAGGNYQAELIEERNDNTGSIIVGAIMQDDRPAPWTNFGERVTVAAYGEKLWTLWGPDGKFDDFGGTSGATPQVAATVALMKEVNPMLTPEQARQVLLETRLVTTDTAKVGGVLRVTEAVQRAKEIPADVAAWSQQSLFREQLRSILNAP